MEEINSLTVFENFRIRRKYDEKKETWYFSVIDIVGALTESANPTDYLKKLRKRDIELGVYLGTKCPQVEMSTGLGKKRKVLAGDMENLFRIIQSIPSRKAEPIKLWLAKVGQDRIKDISDPERSVNRGREYWQKQGRSEKWIQQRMMGQETRNKLTDYWSNNEVKKGDEFAILTNIIHQEWSDLTVKEHKKLKGLEKHNLRDHMTEEELIFTALAEMSTRRIAETDKVKGFEKNKVPAKKGGRIARDARLALEEKTGEKVVTGGNFLEKKAALQRLNGSLAGIKPIKKINIERIRDDIDYSGND